MDAVRPNADQDPGDEAPRSSGTRRAREDDPTREARWAAWQAENAEAIDAFNIWFEQTGHRYLRPPLI